VNVDISDGKSKMSDKKTDIPIIPVDPNPRTPESKLFGGSKSHDWNERIATQALHASWLNNKPECRDTVVKTATGLTAALVDIGPRDTLEGMAAAQLVAAHEAAMECYRRAMLKGQTFEGRQATLNQANRLSRTWTVLLDALNKHRGKGQQKVTVEHVHVHSGGQAIVGSVDRGGGKGKEEEQPHAKQVADAQESPMRSPDATADVVPITRDGKR
jgi:hypothetical protein